MSHQVLTNDGELPQTVGIVNEDISSSKVRSYDMGFNRA